MGQVYQLSFRLMWFSFSQVYA
ncbi:hypothetical protein BpHYR1_028707 [Brachionus plicatilis]|uniref:Uncharacterized protein n=1 Tax=Brachionus plicatilis TaxID=10195 RepID=A0A3M7PLW5_BRAPC|nr:hypothetical protein BpHYR1_028707 [Brachionus plicatilis]